MSIQAKAIDQAIKLLTAAGAQFAVVTPDGTKLGALDIVVPKVRQRGPARFSFQHLGYVDKVKGMQPGDVLHFDCSSKEEANSLRGTLSSTASHHFGKGKCMTTADGNRAEILRVE